MRHSSSTRWAVGTLAVVAIALTVDSIRRTRADYDAARAPQIAVRGQLEAFKRGDYRAAYRYAAPEIQQLFPIADFRRMVEQGFHELAHWKQLSLGAPDLHGSQVAVPVTVTPDAGVPAHFVYLLRHDPGGWRVAGVQRDQVPPRLRTRPLPARRPAPQEMTALPHRLLAG